MTETNTASNELQFGVRVDAEQKEVINKAAARVGLTTSAWVRMVALERARQETATCEIDGEQVIKGLAAGIGYTVTARAAYDPKDHVPGEPVITGHSGTDGGIWLQWDDPESETPITGYEYRAVRPAEDEDWKPVKCGAKNDHVFTGFQNGVEQTIALRAVNAAGPGPADEVKVTPRAKL